MSPSTLNFTVAETLTDGGCEPVIWHFKPFLASSSFTASFPESVPRSLFLLVVAERHDRLSPRALIVGTYVADQVSVFVSSDIPFRVVDGLASPVGRLLPVWIVAIEVEFSA